MHGSPVGDDRQVGALAADAGLPERHGESRRHLRPRHRRVVEELRLEVERDALRAHRGAQEPGRVVREGGHDDADSRQRRQPALDVLRVVQAAADVAARREPHRHVRDVLAVRAPVLVGHLDHLLGRRPEVVGELRALDDDADLVGEPAEAVRRAHDVVLGDRRVEDPRRAELLLHALGDVEDAALLAVRDVLAPDVGVRVVAELLLEGRVQRLDDGHLVARAVGNPVRPRLGDPGLGDDEVVDRRGIGLRRRAGSVRRIFVGLLVLRLDALELLLAEQPRLEQELAEAGERIGRLGGLELLRRAVELVPVRVRVRVDPDAARVDDRSARARPDERDRLAHRAERVEDVEPVGVDDLQVEEAGEVVGRDGVRGLIALRNRDPVAVVLDDDDDRELLPRDPVDRLVEVALGLRGLADRAEDEGVLLVGLDGAAEARGVLRVVRHAGGDVLDPDRRLGEVVRHVPPARGDVGRLGHPVQEDLLGREARGQAGRQVTVVGEEVVPPRPERHAERELDGVVARAGRVVAPAEPLLQVVRRLVVEHAAEMHHRVPFPDFFARHAPDSAVASGLDGLLGFH